MTKLLSICIPVYNMEDYLRRCLDSLLVDKRQMSLLDIIIVNDGSRDSSLSIAREYESRYPETFKVIDKKNGGHGSCCNIGLKEARGKYIHFLDPDDWFDYSFTDYIEKLSTETADAVFTKRVDEYVYQNKSEIHSLPGITYNLTYNSAEFNFMACGTFMFSIHETTFSTEGLRKNGVHFREGVSYDDMILKFAILPSVKKMAFYDMPLYHYLLGRPGQSMNQEVQKRKRSQFHLNIDDLFQFFSTHEVALERNNARTYCLDCLSFNLNSLFGRTWQLPFSECRRQFDNYYHHYKGYSFFNDLKKGFWVRLYEIRPFIVAYGFQKMLRCIRDFIK